ncbi:hypothetical protein BW727_200007 (plasmid) [Jeotgalibaca dankookensis]|uniref:Pentapeptide repeat protein MfpA n=1 Tax=Jeotgalibaca dankookensis TaxID=708126 RepID=A0A1S6ISB6_9LACT|nr:pentapeptide repeat-containing protein [Jeotgalibaca dankookensis]AQS54410.1 hypothetical protein BW727_200007 [Jeotgalibaca dankookensis]
MKTIPFNNKTFVKKKKQKYPRNKFFSYHNKNLSNRNFNFKDFRNSNSIHSHFTNASFYGTFFNKSTLKFCGFNGATFQSVDFVNCNFKGSRFKGTKFIHCSFKECKFEKVNFENAEFINCISSANYFKKSKRFPKNVELKREMSCDNELFVGIRERYENKVLLNSLTKLNIGRLLNFFSLKQITDGLDELNKKDFSYICFSHLTKFIEKNSY